MIYLLVPTEHSTWQDMRLFTTFSSLEQMVTSGIRQCRSQGLPDQWCYVIAYEGTDELSPVWGYIIYEGYLQRCVLTQ